MRDKNVLDNILLKYKAQPVGCGYIDIIVKRVFIDQFVMDVISEGFNINAIGLWEHCKTLDTITQLNGMGGPTSIFFDGWFAEIGLLDWYRLSLNGNIMEKIKTVIELIDNIKIDGHITFKNTEILTPSFNIDVPDNWHNAFVDENGYWKENDYYKNKIANGERPYIA